MCQKLGKREFSRHPINECSFITARHREGPAATHVNNSIISKFKTHMLSMLGSQQVNMKRSLEGEGGHREREMRINTER